MWEQARLKPEKSGTDLSTQAGLCLNSLQICAVNSNAGVSGVIYAAFELGTGTKYSRAVAVNHRERADLFQRQPARHDVPLYEKKIINLLLLSGLPRLPRLFLFSDLFGICSRSHINERLKYNRTNSVGPVGMFQHRDEAMPRVSQLITSVLPLLHEAHSLLPFLSLAHTCSLTPVKPMNS